MVKNLMFLVLFLPMTLLAQKPGEAEFYRRMDLGEDLMKQGRYEEAQEHFLYLLENMSVLPSELAYLFGRNSFHLNQFKQAINWLNKYIQLKGTKGRYYDEAVRYLGFAEDRYLEKQRVIGAQSGPLELAPQDYDCAGLDKMICPVCRGSGVLITRGTFDAQYQTCPYSAGEGYLSCEEYNLFMLGRLEPKIK